LLINRQALHRKKKLLQTMTTQHQTQVESLIRRVQSHVLVFLFLLFAFSPHSSIGQTSTINYDATVLTTEGVIEFLSPGATNWQSAKPGQILRVGDQVRAGTRSRATVRLSNLCLLRVSELMRFEILPARQNENKPIIDVKAGKAYFFSRDRPQEIQLQTPVVTGAIRRWRLGAIIL
jgi:hypothetical protein